MLYTSEIRHSRAYYHVVPWIDRGWFIAFERARTAMGFRCLPPYSANIRWALARKRSGCSPMDVALELADWAE